MNRMQGSIIQNLFYKTIIVFHQTKKTKYLKTKKHYLRIFYQYYYYYKIIRFLINKKQNILKLKSYLKMFHFYTVIIMNFLKNLLTIVC